MTRPSLLVLLALALTSCSSPPRPPSVDDGNKRPLNVKALIDLQSCRSDLSRSIAWVDELSLRPSASTTVARGRAADSAASGSAAAAPSNAPDGSRTNQIVIVEFDAGKAAWTLTEQDAALLAAKAMSAALISVRGRTDALLDSPRETAVARQRAEFAAQFLRSRGVPDDRIRVSWQGAGDGRTTAPQERARNRRVEIEFYGGAPAIAIVRSDGTTEPL